jgi:hypothetical protein
MATVDQSVKLERAKPKPISDYPAGGARFDYTVLALSAWFLAGFLMDAWAHRNVPNLESFWTFQHGVMYTGFLATAAFHLFSHFRNVSKGYAWTQAMPRGYWLSMIGVAIFLVAGIGDMIWHTLFGIERALEAAFSPTHLALVMGGVLIFSGPLRAAWQRAKSTEAPSLTEMFPALLSLLFALSLLTVWSQFSNAVIQPDGLAGRAAPASNTFAFDLAGFSGVLVPTLLITGSMLLIVRRWWRLPFGSITLVLTANIVLMYLSRFGLTGRFWAIPVAVCAASLIADAALAYVKPSPSRVWAFRTLAFVLPFAYFLLFFLTLIATSGIWWTIHMWLGMSVLAGGVGFALSYAFIPPAMPED